MLKIPAYHAGDPGLIPQTENQQNTGFHRELSSEQQRKNTHEALSRDIFSDSERTPQVLDFGS